MEFKDVKLVKGMTKDEINKIIYDWLLLEDEIYLGNAYKHNWRCLCGNIIEGRRWYDISRRNNFNCRKCTNLKIEKNHKLEVEKTGEYEYIRSFKTGEILPNGKIIKVPYLQVKHKYCGSVYEVIRGNFINTGKRCGQCCQKYENSFAYHIEVELGEPLEKYWDFEKNTVNPYHIKRNYTKTKVWIKCQERDYHGSYEIQCSDFIIGNRCSYCNPKFKIHPLDSFGYHHFDKVLSWHPDNNISPFRIASGSHKKYKFICETCSHEWSSTVKNITINSSWCPNCASSKGEKRISEWLILNNINHEKEKIFKGLISDSGNQLRYDFYLPKYNLLIEYDGLQHDKWMKGWITKESFKRTQHHDKLKNEYAINNSIRLIRIKEKDFNNIEKILNEELKL